MKKWIKNNRLYIIGAVLGAVAGFLYWQQVGCVSGTCSITSKPIPGSMYGALMGALLFGMFKKETQTPVQEKNPEHDI